MTWLTTSEGVSFNVTDITTDSLVVTSEVLSLNEINCNTLIGVVTDVGESTIEVVSWVYELKLWTS